MAATATEVHLVAQTVLEGDDVLPVYTIDAMGDLPPPRWFIKNFLEDKGMTLVFGREKTGKSTAVLNILLGWLTGAEEGAFGDDVRFPYMEDPTDHSVLYLLLEGQNTVYYRAVAWARANGTTLPENLYVMGHSISLFNKNVDIGKEATWTADMKKLWNTIDRMRPSVVVIDTFARANPNLDENSPGVSSFVGFLDRLRDEFGVSFIIVHHAPKSEGAAEPRGHSSLPGAATTLIYFKRNDKGNADKGITMWVGRQRNGMDLGDLPYNLVFEQDEVNGVEVAHFVSGSKDLTSKEARMMQYIGDHTVEVIALKKEFGNDVYEYINKLIEKGMLEETDAKKRTVRKAGEA